jgi:MYXO-CTERM domain-containing protein
VNKVKKTITLFLIMTCMLLMFSLSAFAESSSAMGTNHSLYNNTNNGMNTNNYRATATTNSNNYDWGWLGLLGLIGLAGLRGRNRERS